MEDVPLTFPQDQVYQTIGDDGFRRLVRAYYRQIPADDILGAMSPVAALDGAETRLPQFLIFRFGGHPRPGMGHRHFPSDIHSRDRWIMPMNNAFAEAGLPVEAERTLRDFF